jgi:BirA family biotin operon repressor/biotin-[acetyl-CoA-carboxylase] ligase
VATNVLRVDTVDSTQTLAKELAADGAPHGLVVRAERQTAGRGRLSRAWESAPGEGLLFSIVLRPGGPLRHAPLLTFGAVAGLALAFDVKVKWPNDLVIGEPGEPPRKLGGLLGELEADAGPQGPTVRHVVLGVGLNVLQRSFPAHLPMATSLWQERGDVVDRDEVFERAVAAILEWHDHPARLDLWRARAHTLGEHVTLNTGQGTISGVATGLADDGALLVEGLPVHVGEIV